jgi:glycosyltransferase involved in cell wall biosynthesis
MSSRTVSVVMPVYQGSRYLESSLRSVFAQSFRDFDVTVVDDGSVDGSHQIAERVAAECRGDVPFRLVRNAVRHGLVGNWNRCLEQAGGTYVLLFHQDDLLDPEMLRRSVAAFTQHPDLGLVYSTYWCMDAHDRPRPPWSESPFSGRIDGLRLVEALIRENFICCPSVVVPRSVYERVGAYDTRFDFSADLEMWMRIASRYDAFCCPEIGVRYRLHDAQVTADFRAKRKVRGELEYLSAAVVGLRAERARYPRLWQSVVRDSLWMVRQSVLEDPVEAGWALKLLARHPADLVRAVRQALLEKSGLRRSVRDSEPTSTRLPS